MTWCAGLSDSDGRVAAVAALQEEVAVVRHKRSQVLQELEGPPPDALQPSNQPVTVS